MGDSGTPLKIKRGNPLEKLGRPPRKLKGELLKNSGRLIIIQRGPHEFGDSLRNLGRTPSKIQRGPLENSEEAPREIRGDPLKNS